jgi:hypothetical protein
MLLIILSLFLAFILVSRSLESVVEDKLVLERIDKFHAQARIFIEKVSVTTFKTASSGIIINSLKIIIFFFAVIYMVSVFILGIAVDVGKKDTSFISQEIVNISFIMFVVVLLSNGFKTDFLTFYKKTRKTIINNAKNPLVLLLIVLYYFLILGFCYILFIYFKKFNVFNSIIFEKMFEDAQRLWLFSLLFFLPMFVVLIYVIVELILWSLCRLTAFLSYHILKYFCVKSQKLSPKKPLKPLLLIFQTISLVLPPVIAFIKEIFF